MGVVSVAWMVVRGPSTGVGIWLTSADEISMGFARTEGIKTIATVKRVRAGTDGECIVWYFGSRVSLARDMTKVKAKVGSWLIISAIQRLNGGESFGHLTTRRGAPSLYLDRTAPVSTRYLCLSGEMLKNIVKVPNTGQVHEKEGWYTLLIVR